MSYTAAEKAEYFAGIRAQWDMAKALAEGSEEIAEMVDYLTGLNIAKRISPTNVQMVLMQARPAGLDGLPYLDFRSYKQWKESGYQVRKGEKAQVRSITWVGAASLTNIDEDSDEENGSRYPKVTSLFHISQVDRAATQGGNGSK